MTAQDTRLARLERRLAFRAACAPPPPAYPPRIAALFDEARRRGIPPAQALAARLGMSGRELRAALEALAGGPR
jgi:hypothetical protein